jgi:U3 small nucleolar ribonucleoprotein protein LCP5
MNFLCLDPILSALLEQLLGESVAEHPVMDRLLELKYAMEKMKPLDTKIKHQLDRLLRVANTSEADLTDTASFGQSKPNIAAFGFDDDEDESNMSGKGNSKSKKASKKGVDSDEDERFGSDDNEDKSAAKAGVYRAPKMVAMHYEEDDRRKDKDIKAIAKKRDKLQYSEMMSSLREEFGSVPEVRHWLLAYR